MWFCGERRIKMQTSKKVLNAITAIVLIFLSGCSNYVETSSQETVSQEIISSEIIASESSTNESSAVDLPDDDQDTPYTWLVEPTVEADDIGVLSYYQPAYKNGSSQDLDLYTVGRYDENDYTLIRKDNRWGIISYDGEMLLDCDYETILIGFGGQIIAYNTTDNQAYYSLVQENDGTFSANESMEAQLALGTNGRTSLLWTDEDNSLHQSSYSATYTETRTVAAVLGELDHNIAVPDYDKSVTPYAFKYVLVSDQRRVNDEVYDDGGNYSDEIIPLKKNGLWGYLDKEGNTIIPFEYDDAYISDPVTHAAMKAFNATCGTVVLCKDNQYMLSNVTGEEIIPFGEFEQIRPVHNGKAWVKKDGKWGVVLLRNGEYTSNGNDSVVSENNTSDDNTTHIDLKVETEKLTDSDIKPNWSNISSLSLEYPVFTSSDKELESFLDENVSEKILGYINSKSEYQMSVIGKYEYDLSLDDYLSINGTVNNIAYMSNGTPTGKYAFFIDLRNKKILELKDLFMNDEDTVYQEIALKTNKYGKKGDNEALFFNNALLDYDYSKVKFNLNKDTLTIIFDAYEVAAGVAGAVSIEIPVSDINLKSNINGVNTNTGKSNSDDSKYAERDSDNTSEIESMLEEFERNRPNIEIMHAVNRYLKDNDDVTHWFKDRDPYCQEKHINASDDNWFCYISLNDEEPQSDQILGTYSHCAVVDKTTMQCKIVANYQTVAVIDLNEYME